VPWVERVDENTRYPVSDTIWFIAIIYRLPAALDVRWCYMLSTPVYKESENILSISSVLAFHLQIATKRKWTRGDSNPWPPPCEGGKSTSGAYYLVQEFRASTGFLATLARIVFCSVRLHSG
jgi:hypothetical protein